ncbi:MAG TPA: hypothetical protein VKG23_17595 [Thermoanaerobaculia bacterium]|nr:hypothetical protein [Thermoanaerobaculia bacterium]
MPRFLVVRAAVSISLFLGSAALLAGDRPDDRPLPDARAFLDEVRKNLQSDDALLEQYTFTEKRTERRMDGKGDVKKIKSETYEVYPSAEPGKMYRRLVARDDVPIPKAELDAQDRKQEEKTEASERRATQEDEAAKARRQAKEEEERRKEQEVVDEVFRMDDIVVEGRENINGRPTIIVTFAPKAGYKPVTAGGKVIQKLAGRAWVDEQDRQLVRIEARLIDNLGVGPARLARLQKGAQSYFYRRKVNDEIWLPAEARFTGSAKALLFFSVKVDALFQYSDYKKFSVSTDSAVDTNSAPTN